MPASSARSRSWTEERFVSDWELIRRLHPQLRRNILLRDVTVKLAVLAMSKLFRNVPLLTSLKMSPFLCSASFSFPGGFPRKSSRQEAPGTTIPISLDLWHPSVLLAWSGAQPCGARRAERLGRSGGPGQRRARRGGGQLGNSLLHLAADRLMPRMVCRRRPLPFLD